MALICEYLVCPSMYEGSEYASLSVTKEHYSKWNIFKAVGID